MCRASDTNKIRPRESNFAEEHVDQWGRRDRDRDLEMFGKNRDRFEQLFEHEPSLLLLSRLPLAVDVENGVDARHLLE